MEQFKFTKQVLEHEANQEGITNIQNILNRELAVDEVLEYDSSDCNGKECGVGEKCVLGNCIKIEIPEEEEEEG